MAHPRVSVICIFFNAERFFSEAIESVLAQRGVTFELLLVDDGSSDASTAMARDYAARFPDKVRYLEHEGHANRGMSATRNLGLAHARGEFVAFIDSDDRWRAGKLAEQAAILDANADLAMVCGTVNYWSSWEGGEDRAVPTGPAGDTVLAPPETSLQLYPLGKADAPCPSDVMLRASQIALRGGFEAHFTGPLQMYEDQAFFAKVYLAAPVFFSGRIWLDYRQHGGSCVSTVIRDGRYGEVRGYFLDWLQGYLATCDVPGKAAIARQIERAKWRLAHPVLASVERRLRTLTGAVLRR